MQFVCVNMCDARFAFVVLNNTFFHGRKQDFYKGGGAH